MLAVFMLGLMMCTRKNVDLDPSGIVGEIYTVVDQEPVPAGGQPGMGTYLMQNLRYPAAAQRAKIQGKVIVNFVVTSTGKVADVQVTQSVGGGCDEEAVRVIKGMPDWTPGQKNGQAVNVRTSLPILFTIL
jgi:protein TonB